MRYFEMMTNEFYPQGVPHKKQTIENTITVDVANEEVLVPVPLPLLEFYCAGIAYAGELRHEAKKAIVARVDNLLGQQDAVKHFFTQGFPVKFPAEFAMRIDVVESFKNLFWYEASKHLRKPDSLGEGKQFSIRKMIDVNDTSKWIVVFVISKITGYQHPA